VCSYKSRMNHWRICIPLYKKGKEGEYRGMDILDPMQIGSIEIVKPNIKGWKFQINELLYGITLLFDIRTYDAIR